MGNFLLAHSNWMKWYGEKCLKRFLLLSESKHSKGMMLLVIHSTTAEKFSQCTIPLCILLMMWITSGGSKLNNMVFLSILCLFGFCSIYDSITSLRVPRFGFITGVCMGIKLHSVIYFFCEHFWVCHNVDGASVEVVTASCVCNIL